MTERAGHAFDVLASITNRELDSYDGVLAVVSTFTFTFSFSCTVELPREITFI